MDSFIKKDDGKFHFKSALGLELKFNISDIHEVIYEKEATPDDECGTMSWLTVCLALDENHHNTIELSLATDEVFMLCPERLGRGVSVIVEKRLGLLQSKITQDIHFSEAELLVMNWFEYLKESSEDFRWWKWSGESEDDYEDAKTDFMLKKFERTGQIDPSISGVALASLRKQITEMESLKSELNKLTVRFDSVEVTLNTVINQIQSDLGQIMKSFQQDK